MPPRWTESRAAADLAACRAMLRHGSRSFAAASYLLPSGVRNAAVALYAFCRAADDAVDQGGGIAAVEALRDRLDRVYAGYPRDLPADRAFARVVEATTLPRALPDALIEGFAWDAEGRRYTDLSALRAYAVRVAGTVGAMMAVLMNVRDAARVTRAVDLGVAMQLCNIARDVGEDARAGRLYLPTEWMYQAGVDPEAFLARPTFSPALGQVIQRLLSTASAYVQRAQPAIAQLPLTCRFGIGAASLLYAEIGAEVARRGLDSVSGRAVVCGRRKLWVLARGLPKAAISFRPLEEPAFREGAWQADEGAWLVESVAKAAPRSDKTDAWWNVSQRARSFIDLLERLEERERATP